MPTDVFSHKQAKRATALDFWLKPAHASPPPLQRRGLRRAKALCGQHLARTGDVIQ